MESIIFVIIVVLAISVYVITTKDDPIQIKVLNLINTKKEIIKKVFPWVYHTRIKEDKILVFFLDKDVQEYTYSEFISMVEHYELQKAKRSNTHKGWIMD